MSHTFSVVCIKLSNCFPSPCTRLSLARTTTEAPFPCQIFRAYAHSFSAFWFRESPFAFTITIWRTDCRMRLTFCIRLLRLLRSQFLPCCNFGLHRVLLPDISITLRRGWYRCRRTIVQPIRLHPCVCLFLLPYSRSVVIGWLMTLLTCFCHLWVSPPAESLRIGLFEL